MRQCTSFTGHFDFCDRRQYSDPASRALTSTFDTMFSLRPVCAALLISVALVLCSSIPARAQLEEGPVPGKEALNPSPRYSEVLIISVSVCGHTASTVCMIWHNPAVVSNRCTRQPTHTAMRTRGLYQLPWRSVHISSAFIVLWLMSCMQAIVANGFIFLSGSTGTPNTTIEEQTSEILSGFNETLSSLGSSLDAAVQSHVFLANLSDFAGMNSAYVQFFTSNPPARTTVGTGVLGGALLEIDMVTLAY
ncbi:hypothetical protein ABBQ32_003894 [Trebouxia sp. C0010 RCD-2024]